MLEEDVSRGGTDVIFTSSHKSPNMMHHSMMYIRMRSTSQGDSDGYDDCPLHRMSMLEAEGWGR